MSIHCNPVVSHCHWNFFDEWVWKYCSTTKFRPGSQASWSNKTLQTTLPRLAVSEADW
jgi:hypothetical protein